MGAQQINVGGNGRNGGNADSVSLLGGKGLARRNDGSSMTKRKKRQRHGWQRTRVVRRVRSATADIVSHRARQHHRQEQMDDRSMDDRSKRTPARWLTAPNAERGWDSFFCRLTTAASIHISRNRSRRKPISPYERKKQFIFLNRSLFECGV